MSTAEAPIPVLPDDPLFALSPPQREVAAGPGGPLLVLAGAGSGKTRALTHRVSHLLRGGVAPRRILLMTFTNRAAREMLRRVGPFPGTSDPLSSAEDGIWAGTFHHIAVRLLRKHGHRLGLPPFGILDQDQACALLAACQKQVRPPPGARWPSPRTLLQLLSLSVSGELTLEQVLLRRDRGLLPQLSALSGICAAYTNAKVSRALCDFDDLLLLLRLLLLDVPDVAETVQAQFQHVLVDEYQDTSPLQSALCDQIAGGQGNLCVVGDDAQSIYGFRGADLSGIRSFHARWPGARTLHLRDNHRSSPQIVALCNRAIARNPGHDPRPMRAVRDDPGQRPQLCALRDPDDQARFVAGHIADVLSKGQPPSEIAVLYRNHAHAHKVQAELQRRGLPHRLHAGPRDDTVAELLLERPPLRDEPEPQGVVLSTIHKAKGLEWAVVFLIWLCEGHLPAAAGRLDVSEEEERRLFYVAATRARDHLYLCHPLRGADGAALVPSRFVRELCSGDEVLRLR